jgi:hypothetical protein
VALSASALAACGSGNSQSNTAAGDTSHGGAAVSRCAVGQPPALKVRRVPPWVTEKRLSSPPIVLACFHTAFSGSSELVGFRNVGPAFCVTVDDLRWQEPHGEICTRSWLGAAQQWCRGELGCVEGYAHPHGLTQLSGPLDPRVRAVRMTVSGKPAGGEIDVAHISGALARNIHATKPFKFFVAFLRGCVPSKDVKLVLVGSGGSHLGKVRPWSPPAGCGRT